MSAFDASVSRRGFLAGGAGALLLGTGLLAGCVPGQAGTSQAIQEFNSVRLPTYLPFTGVTPDLPGTAEGVDAAFRKYPADPAKSVSGEVGLGGVITAMTTTFYGVPPAADSNSYWAGLNKKLGANLDIAITPQADYATKFATTIAGGDLPDMIRAARGVGFPQLLKAKFQDLTEHLSGDAVLDYPNLANIPTLSWKATVYNGGLYGIPIPRGVIGGYPLLRKDLFDAAGASTTPENYDEFKEGLRALTNAKESRYPFVAQSAQYYVNAIFGVPNNWKYEDGKLLNAIETDEWRLAVEELKNLWEAGLIHPDGYFGTSASGKQLMNAGNIAMGSNEGYTGWMQYYIDNAATKGFELGIMPLPKKEGGGLADYPLGSGANSFTMLKKAEPKKIKEQLRVLNWLAAPFGTAEHYYKTYGEEGVDHTRDSDGNPVLTATGAVNTLVPTGYLAFAPWAIFTPGRPKDADLQHTFQSMEIPMGVEDPTNGLWSEESFISGSAIAKDLTNGVNDVMVGRRPTSDIPAIVSAWRSNGGDKIRAEYQKQLKES